MAYTRKDLLTNVCTHRDYYAQFVTLRELSIVRRAFPDIKRSNDPYFNDISLSRWDAINIFNTDIAKKMRAGGDYPTKSGSVCILKEAARQIFEEKG